MTESRFIARSVSIIALAIATVLMLGSCGFTIGGPQAATCNSDSGNSAFSTIDPEGAACILTFHEARFDMSRGTIAKTALGVDANEYAPDVSSNDGLIELEILGPDGPLVSATDRIRFFTTDKRPDVDRITYCLTANTRTTCFSWCVTARTCMGLTGSPSKTGSRRRRPTRTGRATSRSIQELRWA